MEMGRAGRAFLKMARRRRVRHKPCRCEHRQNKNIFSDDIPEKLIYENQASVAEATAFNSQWGWLRSRRAWCSSHLRLWPRPSPPACCRRWSLRAPASRPLTTQKGATFRVESTQADSAQPNSFQLSTAVITVKTMLGTHLYHRLRLEDRTSKCWRQEN